MITNFFRIQLASTDTNIQRVEYTEQRFSELKTQHNRDASFFRHGDFIYISPRKGSGLRLADIEKISVVEYPAIFQSLIRHLIFRAFRDAFPERIPQSFSPLRFFSNKKEHDFASELLPADLRGRVCFLRMVEVETRQILESNKPSFGLLIRSRQRWQFNFTLKELFDQGFNLVGLGVLEVHEISGLQGVLAPDESLLGEIISTNGADAEIATNNGTIKRRLEELQMQRTRHQIGNYLAFRLGQHEANEFFARLRERETERGLPGVFFAEAVRVAEWFIRNKSQDRVYENEDGFRFTVTRDNTFSSESMDLHRTNLVFDYGPGASATRPLSGLLKFGPFNAARFEKSELRVLVLFNSQSRGAVTQFLKRLIDGIPESKYFQQGMRALFRLSRIDTFLTDVTEMSAEAFEQAIDKAVQDGGTRGFDLALIECPDGSRQIPAAANPYYRSRARLMSYGIPTQGVRDQHLRSSPSQLEWTLGPMALQCYAKVGGTPWRLPATQSVDREILIGIGNSLERPNLWSDAEQSRVVGITTFFLGDGSYMLGERLRSVPYAEYFQELLKSLENAITTVAREYAWQDGDSVRIVFHIFKPIKQVEADVVEKLIQKFPQYKILFAFVTVSTEHPWMMFRDAWKEGEQTKVELCERGDNLILDAHTSLLQIRGDKDRPNKRHRPPFPVSIRLHEKSTYKDLKYISQQIHDFAFLSWRSFFPSEEPVTLFYSNLIASESSRLNKVPGWNPAFLDKHFRRKQWFL